jgi:hypothetical protein
VLWRASPHNPKMAEPHPYSFVVEARVQEPGKFGWAILEGHDRTRVSLSSFDSYEEAERAALQEMDRLAAVWDKEHP